MNESANSRPSIIFPEQKAILTTRAQELVKETHDKKVGVVYFLDRSSRPFAQLFLRAWQSEYPEEPHPEVNFLYVGTAHVRAFFDQVFEKYDQDRNSFPDAAMFLNNLRRVFTNTGSIFTKNVTPHINQFVEESVKNGQISLEDVFGAEEVQRLRNFLLKKPTTKSTTEEFNNLDYARTHSLNMDRFSIKKHMLWPTDIIPDGKLSFNNRLVVDDVIASGWTRDFVEALVRILDPNPYHRYAFTTILTTEENKQPFRKDGRPAQMPWMEEWTTTDDTPQPPAILTRKPQTLSFFAESQKDKKQRQAGLQTYDELKNK